MNSTVKSSENASSTKQCEPLVDCFYNLGLTFVAFTSLEVQYSIHYAEHSHIKYEAQNNFLSSHPLIYLQHKKCNCNVPKLLDWIFNNFTSFPDLRKEEGEIPTLHSKIKHRSVRMSEDTPVGRSEEKDQ